MSQPGIANSDTTRERYLTLLEVAESISAHRQLSTLFHDLSRLLQPLVRFDFIGLTLIDEQERVVRLHVLATDRPVVEKPVGGTPFDQTPTIAALESRHPYYIPAVDAEERYPIVRKALAANGVRSVCVVPLYTAQRDIGGLHFGSEAPNAYSPDDIEFMEQVARPVAVAVDNALNFESVEGYREQLARERDRLRTLLEINNAVVSCLETTAAVSDDLRVAAPRLWAGLRERSAVRPGVRRAAPQDGGLSGRHGGDSRRRIGAGGRFAGGARLPHPAGGAFHTGGGARNLARDCGHYRARGTVFAVLRADDLARKRLRDTQRGIAA